jgi:hypothetical protein
MGTTVGDQPDSADGPAQSSRGWLESVERISRTVSIAAIPVVLAVGGWIIQRQLQNQTVGAAYVNLAVTILENPDKSKVPNELREWAVDLLNDNSPTKLNAKAVASLKSGAVTLPSSFNFVPSPALTQDLKEQIETSLNDFQRYLSSLGFGGDAGIVSVEITPGTMVERKEGSGVALWLPETRSMAVASAFATDRPSVLRQLAHRYLLPRVDTAWANYWAIESGLATYFACSFAGDPVMGGKASDAGKRIFPPQDLRKQRKLSEINLGDWGSVQNDGSEVWGGAFWQIRELAGQPQADKVVALAWRDLLLQRPENARAYRAFGTLYTAENSDSYGSDPRLAHSGFRHIGKRC